MPPTPRRLRLLDHCLTKWVLAFLTPAVLALGYAQAHRAPRTGQDWPQVPVTAAVSPSTPSWQITQVEATTHGYLIAGHAHWRGERQLGDGITLLLRAGDAPSAWPTQFAGTGPTCAREVRALLAEQTCFRGLIPYHALPRSGAVPVQVGQTYRGVPQRFDSAVTLTRPASS